MALHAAGICPCCESPHAIDCDLGDDCDCLAVDGATGADLALVAAQNGTPDDAQAVDASAGEPVGQHHPRFYLGTTSPNWLEKTDVPLFLSRRTLGKRKKLPSPLGRWALDSGGFTELSMFGEWRTTEREYVADVRRLGAEMDGLDWAAPMDWMCEPFVLEKTGLTLEEHQTRTVVNFLMLRAQLGPLVIPVLQGWKRDDYLRCVDLYERSGVDLGAEPVIGLGSVCRRQNMAEAGRIVRSLHPLKLHGFGVKVAGLRSFGDALVSADSMAWSYRARRIQMPGPNAGYERTWRWCCGQGRNCSGCIEYALRWRRIILSDRDQLTLEVHA